MSGNPRKLTGNLKEASRKHEASTKGASRKLEGILKHGSGEAKKETKQIQVELE